MGPDRTSSIGGHLGTRLSFLLVAALLLSGCASYPKQPVMLTQEYGERPPIATSLLPSDQRVLSDEAVAKILSSRLTLPNPSKLALMRFPERDGWGSRRYGSYYWRDEGYLAVQQAQMETISSTLLTSERIAEVTPLPTLMTPERISIPVLREAAVRLQADLVLVFRVGSDTYWQDRTFAKDRVKAYSTCELVLLDVRTGLVPFTRVVSRERLATKDSKDLDLSETGRRAEEESAVEALKAAAQDLAAFLERVPPG